MLTKKSLVLTDLDGTFLDPTVPTPDRVFDPAGLEALSKFNARFPDQVIAVTGRDIKMVRDCIGSKKLPFPVVSSNGAQLTLANGRHIYHAFTKAEMGILRSLRNDAKNFSRANPQLYIEHEKPFDVGFHTRANAGYSHVSNGVITDLSESFRSILAKYALRAEKVGLPFHLESQDTLHLCFTHSRMNKVVGIMNASKMLQTIPKSNDWRNVIYMGDGLLDGNDRAAAIHVRKRGGRVLQVINHDTRRIPDHGDAAEPHYVVVSPAELGQTVKRWVAKLKL